MLKMLWLCFNPFWCISVAMAWSTAERMNVSRASVQARRRFLLMIFRFSFRTALRIALASQKVSYSVPMRLQRFDRRLAMFWSRTWPDKWTTFRIFRFVRFGLRLWITLRATLLRNLLFLRWNPPLWTERWKSSLFGDFTFIRQFWFELRLILLTFDLIWFGIAQCTLRFLQTYVFCHFSIWMPFFIACRLCVLVKITKFSVAANKYWLN